MKIIVHALAALSLVQMAQQGDPLTTAYALIEKVIASVEVDLAPDPNTDRLTETEKRQVGRYFESPQLAEVYPGIGKAMSLKKRP